MFIEILTPDEKIFEGEVLEASFPGTDGSFQVLNNHAPLVSTMGKGDITYHQRNKKPVRMMIEGGVVEVINNKVNVLVEKVYGDRK